MALPTIVTSRLTLRPVEPGDLDAFAEYMADPEVVRFISDRTLTRDETVERMAAWRVRFERDGFGQFALERREDALVVGRCGLLVWQLPEWTITTMSEASGPRELELGWMLGRAHWGHGYATEAATAVRDFTLQTLGRSRLISLIAVANTRSASVARRLGMTVEGLTRMHDLDVEIWSLAREA
jgi:RimJ/RimL family protein N-acetyltransferase